MLTFLFNPQMYFFQGNINICKMLNNNKHEEIFTIRISRGNASKNGLQYKVQGLEMGLYIICAPLSPYTKKMSLYPCLWLIFCLCTISGLIY